MTKLIDTYLHTEEDIIFVMGSDARGGEYMLNHQFTDRHAAERLLIRLRAAGSIINDNLWSYRPTYGSLSWHDCGMEEATIYAERHEGLGEANEYDYRQEAYGATAMGLED